MNTFGRKRPVRNAAGEITGLIESPACAMTHGELDASFGAPDRDRKLIVSLEAGDLIVMRPQGTRRPMKAAAIDVYRWMIRCEANRITLERARDKKSRKAQRLADARQKRAEARLRRPIKE